MTITSNDCCYGVATFVQVVGVLRSYIRAQLHQCQKLYNTTGS